MYCLFAIRARHCALRTPPELPSSSTQFVTCASFQLDTLQLVSSNVEPA